MKLTITSLMLALFLASGIALADNHKAVKERRVIIQTTGGEENIEDIMARVEREVGEDSDANVMVTVDEDGKVLVKKLAPGEALPMERFHGKNMEHEIVMHKMHNLHGGPMPHMQKKGGKPMSKEAANCVLKNISKASTDTAARLVRRACSTLNPAN